MSRKQAAKARPSARKGRRPRHPPAAPAPGHSGGLAGQLRALGLKLREVPGDGNCLFRALGDQLEGHSRNHLRHRQDTVEFMMRQRGDFEPFVEDDVPFDKHVANLAKPGTFAGNDAIVAFARNNQINVVIHQFNAPLWQDTDLVSHVLEVEDYNVESAIFAILQMKEGEGIGTEEQQEPPGREQKSCSRTLWEENGTASRIFGNQSLHQGEAENAKGRAGSREENRGSRNSKVAKKQRKKQQWLEKKRQQEERHRQKVLASKRDSADTRTDTDPAKQVTLVKAMAALNI